MEEKIEIKGEVQEPTGGGVKEEITVPIQTDPSASDSFFAPSLPVPKLPMGTITETISIPSVPATINTYNNSYAKPKKMFPEGKIEQTKTEPNGTITIKREICDGEINIGPFKSCLKEFTGVSAVGWIFAAAGLIVLWKWLDWRFKK